MYSDQTVSWEIPIPNEPLRTATSEYSANVVWSVASQIILRDLKLIYLNTIEYSFQCTVYRIQDLNG